LATREGDAGDVMYAVIEGHVELVQEHPTFALLVMNVMAERIRRSNALHDRGSRTVAPTGPSTGSVARQ
jgi:hypothetical protein